MVWIRFLQKHTGIHTKFILWVYHYHNIIDGRDSLKQAAEKQENQKNFDTIAEPKQQNEIQSEVKKPSILTALHNFKPKENTTEIKKQREVVL